MRRFIDITRFLPDGIATPGIQIGNTFVGYPLIIALAVAALLVIFAAVMTVIIIRRRKRGESAGADNGKNEGGDVNRTSTGK